MRLKISTIIFFCLIFFCAKIFSQCTEFGVKGQTPQTAFPICGTDTFHQSTVPACVNNNIPVPGCNPQIYSDQNPFWYKFTCYTSGNLSFTIVPNNLGDDYDWQLFDVTGLTDLNSVYTNTSYFVVCNWSGSYGITGAAITSPNKLACASDPAANETTFSLAPFITQGHEYLLMISHFSGDDQSGYGLSFSGAGSNPASITDTTKPRLQTALANCSGDQISISINKNIKCTSVDADGSNFTIIPAVAGVKIISESGTDCDKGFVSQSVVINLSNSLPPGNYQIVPRKGNDENTLLDNCSNPVFETDTIPLTILPLAPTPLDSIIPLTCAPDTLQLVFRKNIQCNSIAADGSDFVVTGPFPVSVKMAAGNNCNNGLSNIIDVVLSSPIVNAGIYTITLKQGSDGNTIIDECGQQTPAGEFLNFNGYDTVSGTFSYKISLGCKYDSVQFFHDLKNSVNEFTWVFDGTDTSHLQDPLHTYTNFLGIKNIQLFVSNGVCTDTSSVNIQFDNYLKAMFDGPDFVCPNDGAVFKDTSVGNIISWFWSFGDGFTSTQQNPLPHIYPKTPTRNDIIYPVELIVQDNINCFDTTSAFIKALYNCYIAVPSAFTPNGDGLNDFLYPLNAYKATNLDFSIYNRLGQLVFHTTNWQIKWDGKIDGKPQPSGTYVWMLSYTDGDTQKKIFQKGTSVLIR